MIPCYFVQCPKCSGGPLVCSVLSMRRGSNGVQYLYTCKACSGSVVIIDGLPVPTTGWHQHKRDGHLIAGLKQQEDDIG